MKDRTKKIIIRITAGLMAIIMIIGLIIGYGSF